MNREESVLKITKYEWYNYIAALVIWTVTAWLTKQVWGTDFWEYLVIAFGILLGDGFYQMAREKGDQ